MNRYVHHRRSDARFVRRRGFTLVERMVVITIIAS